MLKELSWSTTCALILPKADNKNASRELLAPWCAIPVCESLVCKFVPARSRPFQSQIMDSSWYAPCTHLYHLDEDTTLMT